MIGAGAWGVNHARVFSELNALEVVCDLDPLRRTALAGRYADTPVTSSVADVLNDDRIEGVVLATPARTHAALAGQFLAAGKDVLVEKPMALTVSDAERLQESAESGGRILAVGHVLEYHPAILRLRELAGSGDLGRIRYLYSNRLNFGTIRTEENVLWSFAPHDIAIMLRLVGAPPERVACHGESYVSRGVFDTTLTSMTFAAGIQAHIYVSWLHPFKEQRLVVVGERRMVVFDDTAPWAEKLMAYDHEVDWEEGLVPVARKVAGEAILVALGEPLRLQAEAFLTAIETRRPPLTDGASGVTVLRVLEAAQRSIEQHGAPVALDASHHSHAHPTATIDPGATIGSGTKIWHHAHVMTGARVGRDCTLGQNVFVGPDVRIGDGCKIQNNVSIFEGVTLEDRVFCGPSVVFTNVKHPRAEVDRRGTFETTLVCEGATLGANATIVCGVRVGRYAFVAAGSVVAADVPDHALVLGNPARQGGFMCRCGTKLPDADPSRCSTCGRSYVVEPSGLRGG